jgi:hypothetical protein
MDGTARREVRWHGRLEAMLMKEQRETAKLLVELAELTERVGKLEQIVERLSEGD